MPSIAHSLRRGFAASALALAPLIAPIAAAHAGTAPGANPIFRPLLPRLMSGIDIPVLLPRTLPAAVSPRPHLYATLDDRGAFAYDVNIGYTPDCHGMGACRYGEVTGGPELNTPTIFDYPRAHHVRLHNGALGLYFPYTCGASCGDSALVFQDEGIVYMVSIKAGSLPAVLAMANSVVRVS